MWTGVTGPHWIRHLTEFPSDCTEFRETFPFETALGHGQVQGRNRRWSFSHSGILPRKDTGSFLFSKKPISRRRRWLGADYNRHRYGRGLAGRTKNRTQQKKSRKENRKAIDTHTHTHTKKKDIYIRSRCRRRCPRLTGDRKSGVVPPPAISTAPLSSPIVPLPSFNRFVWYLLSVIGDLICIYRDLPKNELGPIGF